MRYHLTPVKMAFIKKPGRHGETLSLYKIKKFARPGGVCLWSQLLGRLRQEDHLSRGVQVNCDLVNALQATERDLVSKTKENKTKQKDR